MNITRITIINILVLIIATLSGGCLIDGKKLSYETQIENKLDSKNISAALEEAIMSSEFEEVIRPRLKRTLKELDVYAGKYLDDQNFVYGVVGLTEEDFKHIELLLSEKQQGNTEYKAQIFSAKVTLNELESLREKVHLEVSNLERQGIMYTNLSMRISENRVVLGIYELDDRKLEIVHKKFGYHHALEIKKGEIFRAIES